ncbi:MAG: hypothetical protein E6J90_49600 [Deltaproteobacteria bacterium]|nr:MAG: hypothetical protein E6J90_49600 [Deltaproteobacteria bacterium]
MDDERNADVYFVERNAVNDHRVMRPTVVSSSRAPAYVPPAASSMGTRVTYGGPASFAGPAQWSPQGFFAGNQPVYAQPPAWGWGQQPGTLGSLFGGLNAVNIGMLVDLIGQGFAAVRSLPTPPTTSGDGSTDVANLTLYQTALAEHAQTDERIRTAVHIIGKLLGA